MVEEHTGFTDSWDEMSDRVETESIGNVEEQGDEINENELEPQSDDETSSESDSEEDMDDDNGQQIQRKKKRKRECKKLCNNNYFEFNLSHFVQSCMD